MTLVVECHIEGLGISSKLWTLQITPLVTDGTQGALLSIFRDFNLFGQWGLVIHKKWDEHIVIRKFLCYWRIGPNSSFHLTAIHTTKTCKVDHDRLTLGFCYSHTLLIIRELGTNFIGLIEIEILRWHGRSKGTDGLTGSAPKTRNHIEGKSQWAHTKHNANHGPGLFTARLTCLRHSHRQRLIALESKPPQKIGAH